MESVTVDTVTGWDSGPFKDGYAGLRDLADRGFTGAVTNGTAWLFMLNGRVIGVFDGSMDSFEDADGTAYEAPHPALPLLYTMRETGGETRAKYYTEKTPLPEVDQTLKGGKFTGYVELSENVLSGDYYTVYQGGKSMSVGFVGNNRRLISGDEAFERAADEVGIYEVKTVDIRVVDIPAPDPDPSETSDAKSDAAGAAGAAGVSSATGAANSSSAADADDPAPDSRSSPSEATPDQFSADADPDPTRSDAPSDASQGSVTFGDDPLAEGPTDGGPADADPRNDEAVESKGETTPDRKGETTTDAKATEKATRDGSGTDTDAATAPSTASADSAGVSPDTASPDTDPLADPHDAADRPAEPTPDRPENGGRSTPAGAGSAFEDEANWRETRTIPALDPEESVAMDEADANGSGTAPAPQSKSQSRPGDATSTQSGNAGRQSRDAGPSSDASNGQAEQRLQSATSQLEEVRTERDRLAARVEQLEAERTQLSESSEQREREFARLKRERDEARERVATLESTVTDLEAAVDRLEANLAEARQSRDESESESRGRDVPVDRAFEGTNLFVRYSRKGGPSLDDAFDGTANRDEVNENLRLEYHTDFDAEGATVDGRPFDGWLEETIEYGFSTWVVTEFIHDIRETRNQAALEELYEAIPDIDRIEFRGTVDLPTEDGGTASRTFDVVLRDRMGDPLLVANLNDSREPATESMAASLVESATPLGEVEPSLAGAFFVTTSYFEPGALETAHEATGGGLLRRERRKSFVKLSRKEGYHLCLVETRNGEFHVNVPEL